MNYVKAVAITHGLHLRFCDIAFCLLAIVFAYFVQQGRIGSSVNGVYLSTDAAQYCAMAAATAHPESFTRDDVYADPDTFGVHATVMVPIIASLAENNNYGLAYLKLTGLHAAVHIIAFYFMGLFIFQRRTYAVILALLMQQAYWVYWGTYFGGGYLDYTPRTTFELFYPFFICGALALLHKPRWWLPFMMLFGLMVYVHSISTLPIAIGFLLGFLLHRPKGVSRTKHFAWICVCGLGFTAVIAPFVLKFLRHSVTITDADVAVLRGILVTRFDIEFSKYWQAIGNYILHFIKIPLLPLTALAAWGLCRWGTPREKCILGQFAMWGLGVVIVVVLFLADQEVALLLGRHHYEFDFIRVLRFLPFFGFCIVLMGTVVLLRLTAENKRKHAAALALTAVICCAIALGGEATLTRQSLLWHWNSADPARYAIAYAPLLRRAAMIEALKQHTEPGSTIFYPAEDQAIRHNALRSLVYGWKDASIFYYAKNVDKLRRWAPIHRMLRTSPTAYIPVAAASNADYVLSDRPEDLPLLQKLGSVVWQGDGYVLLKKDAAPADALPDAVAR